jgi:hypothetical protein
MKHLQLYNQYNSIYEQTDPNEEESFGSALLRGGKSVWDFLNKDLNPFGDDETKAADKKYQQKYLDVAKKYKGTGQFPTGWKLTNKNYTKEIGDYFNIPPCKEGDWIWNNSDPKSGKKGIWVAVLTGQISNEDIEELFRKYLLPNVWNNWVKEHDVVGPLLEDFVKGVIAPEAMMVIWTKEGVDEILPRPSKPYTILDLFGGLLTIVFSVNGLTFLNKWFGSLSNKLMAFFQWLKGKAQKLKQGVKGIISGLSEWKEEIKILWNMLIDENKFKKLIMDYKKYYKTLNTKPIVVSNK